ncbi:MAG: hypothetical protein LBG95_09845 [Treponema sp.]|jgi:hypothetical protein|nr:hypothetical protein [Treponema sp.]
MGLLERAIACNNTRLAGTNEVAKANALINDFASCNPLFHCIVFLGNNGDITTMMAGHHAVCARLHGEKCLVLLAGGLDRELFAHRLSLSARSDVLFQCSANSASLAIEILDPYLR